MSGDAHAGIRGSPGAQLPRATRPVCHELTVVIHPRDYEKINMLEVDAFLRTI